MVVGKVNIKDSSATHTYIGNYRELADSTENVVPNPWRQHVHENRKRGRGMCVCVRVKDRNRDKNGGAEWSKGKEK